MPKPTFFNLPDDKRELIIRLAVDEFADNDYDTASISKIVAQAGIAKGSFYQYFEDKRDLYLFLLSEGTRIKGEFLAQHPPPDPAMNLFAYLHWLLKVGMKYEFAHRKLARIAQRAISGQGPFQPEWGQQVEAQSMDYFRGLITQGIASGQVRPDLNVEMTAYLFSAVLRDMSVYVERQLGLETDTDLIEAFAQREAEVEALFDQLFDVLEKGISRSTDR